MQAATARQQETECPLSKEAMELIDHIADILAEEFVRVMKRKETDEDEGSDLRAVLKR